MSPERGKIGAGAAAQPNRQKIKRPEMMFPTNRILLSGIYFSGVHRDSRLKIEENPKRIFIAFRYIGKYFWTAFRSALNTLSKL
jgi:hypothetical protein